MIPETLQFCEGLINSLLINMTEAFLFFEIIQIGYDPFVGRWRSRINEV
jgi:hypothetical protein